MPAYRAMAADPKASMLGNRIIYVASATLLAAPLFFAALPGCGPTEKIEHYRVDKPAAPDRMLAAIVEHGSKFWFFKMAGPAEAIAKEGEQFARFLVSVQFADSADAPPEWTLPEGWQQQPGTGLRFATFQIDADEPLEMSVTTLLRPAGDDNKEAILSNVNRWRGQMGLSAITIDQLGEHTRTIPLAGGQATVVSLEGRLKAGGMGSPPFANGEPPPAGHPPVADGPGVEPAVEHPAGESPPAVASSPGLTYKTPSGWKPGPTGVMRRAAFTVEDGAQKAEITVMPFPPTGAMSDLLTNVNRWRGQINLPKIDADELPKVAQPIQVGGATGHYVQLTSPADSKPRQTILGVMAVHGDQVWFVKLQGNAELAEHEKPRFESFVKSIKFTGK